MGGYDLTPLDVCLHSPWRLACKRATIPGCKSSPVGRCVSIARAATTVETGYQEDALLFSLNNQAHITLVSPPATSSVRSAVILSASVRALLMTLSATAVLVSKSWA